ncbi:carboxylesterase/lipase family protein [Streptomyces sp. NBC_00986]|uniref:carboxylesterase/lipase family protein n=1 Tax=Streptomyces sp. NBC_00986 TaxID=2903702 RepID=UPI00386DE175
MSRAKETTSSLPSPERSRRPAVTVFALMLAVAGMLSMGVSSATADTPAPGSGAGGRIVHTMNGTVAGTTTDSYRSFEDIPFAKAPVGPLRWKPPQPAASWSGVRDATAPGPACTQTGGSGTSSSEDCLNLNVWTPADAHPGSKLPVAVWIYGGAYRSGSSSSYQPVSMVDQGDMLVVTINYRLGAMGFLTLPQLDKDNGAPSGDYGLLDQIQALHWVRQNVAQFGGDPSRVMIAGQSAGGESVCTLLASPKAAGLFSRAVVESGLTCIEADRKDAQRNDAAFVTDAGCDSSAAAAAVMACLRHKSPAEILAAQTAAGQIWYPTTQVPALPEQAPVAFATAAFNHVPVLIGTTGDEGASFIYSATDAVGKPVTAATYRSDIQASFGATAPQVLDHYPLGDYSVPGAAEAQIKTDVAFTCPMLSNAASLTAAVPTYVYEFRDTTAAGNIDGGPEHAAELPYLWGTKDSATLTDEQRQLSHAMIAYWAAFARTGTLAAHGLPPVPHYAPATPHEIAFNSDGPALVSDTARNHQCGYWDSYFTDGFPFHFSPGSPLTFPSNDQLPPRQSR